MRAVPACGEETMKLWFINASAESWRAAGNADGKKTIRAPFFCRRFQLSHQLTSKHI